MDKKTIEEIYMEHLDKEPRQFENTLHREIKLRTTAYIKWEILKENMEKVIRIDQNKRQKILDRFKKGGITIGEVAELFNESSEAVGQLIYYNIDQAFYLRNESV